MISDKILFKSFSKVFRHDDEIMFGLEPVNLG